MAGNAKSKAKTDARRARSPIMGNEDMVSPTSFRGSNSQAPALLLAVFGGKREMKHRPAPFG